MRFRPRIVFSLGLGALALASLAWWAQPRDPLENALRRSLTAALPGQAFRVSVVRRPGPVLTRHLSATVVVGLYRPSYPSRDVVTRLVGGLVEGGDTSEVLELGDPPAPLPWTPQAPQSVAVARAALVHRRRWPQRARAWWQQRRPRPAPPAARRPTPPPRVHEVTPAEEIRAEVSPLTCPEIVAAEVKKLRERLHRDLGICMPPVVIRTVPGRPEGWFKLSLRGQEWRQGEAQGPWGVAARIEELARREAHTLLTAQAVEDALLRLPPFTRVKVRVTELLSVLRSLLREQVPITRLGLILDRLERWKRDDAPVPLADLAERLRAEVGVAELLQSPDGRLRVIEFRPCARLLLAWQQSLARHQAEFDRHGQLPVVICPPAYRRWLADSLEAGYDLAVVSWTEAPQALVLGPLEENP